MLPAAEEAQGLPVTTYGDDLANALNAPLTGGSTGLWLMLILFVAVLISIAGIVLLIRAVRSVQDAV